MSEILGFFFSVNDNQIIGTMVNIVILAIGASAALQIIRAIWQRRQDLGHLDPLDSHLKAQANAGAVIHAVRDLRPNHPLHARVAILKDLHAAGADPEVETLAALTLAEFDRDAPFARWASSYVVLLGLAGTLIGLTQAVLQAKPMLGELMTGPAAVDAVMATFAGLGTAFSTTLMGIFWAVALGLLLGGLRGIQNRLLRRLETLSLIRLYPHFRTSPALAMVEAARSLGVLEQKMSISLEEVVAQLKTQGLALVKIVEDSIGRLVEESGDTGRELRDTVKDSLNLVVEETQQHGVALTSTVDRSLTTLIEDMRQGFATLLERFENTLEAMVLLVGEPREDSRTLTDNLLALEAGVRAVDETSQQLVRMTPSIEEAIARQVDRQSRDLHETMHEYVGALSKGIERQDDVIETGLTRLRDEASSIGEMLRNRVQEHGAAMSLSMEKPIRELSATIEAFSQSAASLKSATEGLQQGVALIREDRTDFRSVEMIPHQLKELSGLIQHLIEQRSDGRYTGMKLDTQTPSPQFRSPMPHTTSTYDGGRDNHDTAPEPSSSFDPGASRTSSQDGGRSSSRTLLDRLLGRKK